MYQELCFVLVEMNGIQSILASTSLTLDPLSVIRFYSYRFRMHLQGTEAAGWRILLPLLVKIHAKTKLLPEEKGTDTPGACEGRKIPGKWKLSVPLKCIWYCPVLQ